ncbi:MAG: leucine-rich repeat protein [Lachnospiraceae bacterium]|nr:leucine-rich repeat protein [Lachnospiraceae bacterium]
MRTRNYIRLLLSILSICFCITFCEHTSYATSFTEDYLTYIENEDGTLTVTGYDTKQYYEYAPLEIKNTVNGKTVTKIADKAFQNQNYQYIEIDNNIDIGDYAFSNINVSGITYADGTSLSITIGSDNTGTTNIGNYAFTSASFWSKVYIKSNIIINDCAFRLASFSLQIYQPDSIVTHIGKRAFENSNYSSGLNYAGLVTVDEYAFKNCPLTCFTISPTLKTFKGTFSDGLYGEYSHIYIDKAVTDISSFGLNNLSATIFHISNGSPLATYCSNNNMLFTVTEDENPDAIYSKPIIGQLISNDIFDVIVTGDFTAKLFRLKETTNSITFDETAIVDYHGYQYTITTIGSNSIVTSELPYLTTIHFGTTITKLYHGAIFDMGMNISYISFAYTNPSTEMGSIPSSSYLTIELLPSVTSIEALYTSELSQVTFLVQENSPLIQMLVDKDLIFQTPGSEPITPDSPDYPAKTTTESEYAPNAPNALDPNQTVTDSMTTTASDTNSSTSKRPAIGTIFTYTDLKYKVTGKKTVTFMKPAKKTITKLKVPAYVIYDKYKFYVTKVATKACYKCTKLKTVVIGANVTHIGDSAFAKCSSLRKITFGKNVKHLGKKVLYNDKKLEQITFQGTKLKSIGKKTFRKVPKQVDIIVPRSKVKKYSRLINNAI